MAGAAADAFWPQQLAGENRGQRRNPGQADEQAHRPTRTAAAGQRPFDGFAQHVVEEEANRLCLANRRIAIFAGPVIAYTVTKRICLGLQRKDRDLLEHGVETGIIRQLPSGEFTEQTRPVDDGTRAVLTSRATPPALTAPPPGQDRDGVPSPGGRHAMGRLRAQLYQVFHEAVPLADGANGNGNGGDGHRELPAREGKPAEPPSRA